jgi:hypothetical protein
LVSNLVSSFVTFYHIFKVAAAALSQLGKEVGKVQAAPASVLALFQIYWTSMTAACNKSLNEALSISIQVPIMKLDSKVCKNIIPSKQTQTMSITSCKQFSNF